MTGKELVLELQEQHELPAAIAIVVRSGQTVALTAEARRFFRKVEFDATSLDGAEHVPSDGF